MAFRVSWNRSTARVHTNRGAWLPLSARYACMIYRPFTIKLKFIFYISLVPAQDKLEGSCINRNSPSSTDIDTGPSSDFDTASSDHIPNHWNSLSIVTGLITVVTFAPLIGCLALHVGECVPSIMQLQVYMATIT